MVESAEYHRYRDDAAVLTQIGRCLAASVPFVDVTLPATLVDTAIAAWERSEDGPASDESDEQRRLRDHAAELAMLGLVLSKQNQRTGDGVAVRLPISHFAAAIAAADNRAS